ncbi:MAG: hypothetical protein EHM70_05335 [Chloroflexota bacterium]|nr:MAG: hypothetical protein EHM70_05335 [Chloroflexota bacterium]
MRASDLLSSAIKVMAGTLAFALLHSALASRAAKASASRWLGARQRNGLYRVFFIVQSFVSLAALYAYARRLPDAVIYRVKGPLAALMRLGQAGGLAYAVYTAAHIGFLKVTGLESLLAWLGGKSDVPAEPEAQGPPLQDNGNIKATGPFTLSRHPLNFSPLPVFWLNPVMTTRLAAFNLAATVYLVLGSIHEETRLRAAYGEPYTAYQKSETPFYVPSVLARQPE